MVDQQRPTNFSTAVNRKYPEQVVIAIADDLKGTPNPITLGWTMVTSHQPPMLAISVAYARYSYENIKRAKEFVVSFPSKEMAKDALFYGTRSGRDMEKIKEFGSKTEPCKKISGVIFTEAVANFECRLVGELPSGDHAIFAGEVVQGWVNTERRKERLYTLGTGYKMGSVTSNLVVEYSPSLFKK